MKHFVFWAPEADEKLQSLIRGADQSADQGADQGEDLVRVVREIDVWLARDPLDFGESRYDTVRLGVAPLTVLHDVLDNPRAIDRVLPGRHGDRVVRRSCQPAAITSGPVER